MNITLFKMYIDDEGRLILPVYHGTYIKQYLCFVQYLSDKYQFFVLKYNEFGECLTGTYDITKQLSPEDKDYKEYLEVALKYITIFMVRDLRYLVLQNYVNVLNELKMIEEEYLNEKTKDIKTTKK